tara:strand:+ start:693 stop:911 length:219 start_codon:yes stop_codon:yes gene_type:complete
MTDYQSPEYNRQLRKRRMLSGEAGKGDKRRPTNESAYQLGMKLIKIADEYGKDSKEYKDTLKAWRKAVQEGL